jgi:hypothetical protein
MASDREKILAEIERMRADADGRYARADRLNDDCGRCDSVGRDTACGQIKSFITALPAAEEVQRWAVYDDNGDLVSNEEGGLCCVYYDKVDAIRRSESLDEIEQYDAPYGVVRVAIRRLEDK